MCGRYGNTNADKEKVKKRFRLKRIDFDWKENYNIAPGYDVPVILNEAPDEMQLARWGLIPFWAKDEKIGYKMINARAETIFEKPAYRTSIKRKRCLIPADFFFEWKQQDGGKQPYCIRLKSKDTFCFAGIWDCWQDELISCSIITCEPNPMMASIHNRMPVILEPSKEHAWLEGEDIKELMVPLKPELLEAFPVAKTVNSPSNNHPDIIKEL